MKVKLNGYVEVAEITEEIALTNALTISDTYDTKEGVNFGEDVLTKLYYISPKLGKVLVAVSENDKNFIGVTDRILANTNILDYPLERLPSHIINYKELIIKVGTILTSEEILNLAKAMADKYSAEVLPDKITIVKVINYNDQLQNSLVMPTVFGDKVFQTLSGISTGGDATEGLNIYNDSLISMDGVVYGDESVVDKFSKVSPLVWGTESGTGIYTNPLVSGDFIEFVVPQTVGTNVTYNISIDGANREVGYVSILPIFVINVVYRIQIYVNVYVIYANGVVIYVNALPTDTTTNVFNISLDSLLDFIKVLGLKVNQEDIIVPTAPTVPEIPAEEPAPLPADQLRENPIAEDVGIMFNGQLVVNRATLEQMIANGDDVTNVNTYLITDMSHLLQNNADFNQDISGWDVSNVTDTTEFSWDSGLEIAHRPNFLSGGETPFTAPVPPVVITDLQVLRNMIANNEDVRNLDVSGITDMNYLFYNTSFNQDISGWDVSNVTDISHMFFGATSFNQDISSWNVGSVTNMQGVFSYATSFNQDISGWDVSSVTNTGGMFNNATSFNQDISGWDVSSVTAYDYFNTSGILTPAQLPNFGV